MTDTAIKMTSLGSEAIMKMDVVTLKMLVLSSAAHILHECKNWVPDPEGCAETGAGLDVSTWELAKNTNWAQHGYINALQTHVQLVYEFQYSLMKGWLRGVYGSGEDEITLIIKALAAYQDWKTAYIERDERVSGHGPNWGKGTEFNRADWTDNNAGFLAWWRELTKR